MELSFVSLTYSGGSFEALVKRCSEKKVSSRFSATASSSNRCLPLGFSFDQVIVLRRLRAPLRVLTFGLPGLIAVLIASSFDALVRSVEDLECPNNRSVLSAAWSFSTVAKEVGTDSSSIVWPRGQDEALLRLRFRKETPSRCRSRWFCIRNQ